MSNLINFFFSFDKLMKEKLVIAFYWLAIIVGGLKFSAIALKAVWLGPLAGVLNFVNFFATILLSLVALRLLCETAVAIFRINNNLSPDGGKSETADIDPIAEARKAAEAAAVKARDMSKSAVDKTSSATKSAVEKTKHTASDVKDSVEDTTANVAQKTKSVTRKAKAKVTKPATTKTPAKKTTAKKTTSKKTSSTVPKKRGPKPGYKAPRDAQGNLLKKDGTPRKKPGPKPK